MFILYLFPIVTLLYIVTFCFVGQWKYKATGFPVLRGVANIDVVKILCLITLIVNFLYTGFLWKMSAGIGMFTKFRNVSFLSNILFEVQHSINTPFILLSTLILVIALLTSWYSIVNFFLICPIYLLLEACLMVAFTTSSLFLFLFVFELSALLIFILIIYCGSARREKLKSSYYFIFFTLYGSISLIILAAIQYSLYQINFIGNILDVYSNNYLQWLLLFVAFAVKIPIFPFHIWLPYAHVEASTSTSIILAALMLKLGGYGLIKFLLPSFDIEIHLFFRPFVIFICLIGMLYSSIVMLGQIDLKRLIAFSSIAHMSIAVIGIFTFTDIGIRGSIYMMISHGLVSSLFFYLAGILSDRFHTRSIVLFSGLIATMPLFSSFFIFTALANIGFPGTSSFLAELFILISMVSVSHSSLFVVISGMLVMAASTLLLVLRILFGHVKVIYFSSNSVDLTKIEFVIISILVIFIIGFGFVDILF